MTSLRLLMLDTQTSSQACRETPPRRRADSVSGSKPSSRDTPASADVYGAARDGGATEPARRHFSLIGAGEHCSMRLQTEETVSAKHLSSDLTRRRFLRSASRLATGLAAVAAVNESFARDARAE